MTSKPTQKRVSTLKGTEPEPEHGIRDLAHPVTITADPGPPPAMPVPPHSSAGLDVLARLGERRARADIEVLPTLRMGPEVAQYKAALLSWLDAMQAYEERAK